MKVSEIIPLTEAKLPRKIINLRNASGDASGYVENVDERGFEDIMGALGTPGLCAELAKKYKRIALLDSLYIEKDKRKTGLGKSLMREFLQKAKSFKAQAVLLEAASYIEPQPDFNLTTWYEKFGFRKIGKFSPDRETVMMFLDLSR